MEKAIRKKIEKAFYSYAENKNIGTRAVVDWAESNFAVDYSKVNVQSTPGGKETQLC